MTKENKTASTEEVALFAMNANIGDGLCYFEGESFHGYVQHNKSRHPDLKKLVKYLHELQEKDDFVFFQKFVERVGILSTFRYFIKRVA